MTTGSDEDLLDAAVARSAGRLTGEEIGLTSNPEMAGGPEHRLVLALRSAFSAEANWTVDNHESHFKGHLRWTREPGGVDLVARVNGQVVLAEAKVGKPEEALWDVIKLADLMTLGQGRRGYLAYAGHSNSWQSGSPGVSLLRGAAARRWSVAQLISDWPTAWGYLLKGSAGIYPRLSTAAFDVVPVAEVELGDLGHSLIVAAVSSSERYLQQEFDPDGWPVGYEPPDDLRRRSRPTSRPPMAGSKDPCHGYAWRSPMTMPRIALIVREIGDDDAAYACLRTRLHEERHWTERELRERVDPLRHRPIGEDIGEPDPDVEAALIAEATRRRKTKRKQ